ncbi:MAG: type II toxin-antitoxin system VapC family toxin [Desulfobacterales bacterium]
MVIDTSAVMAILLGEAETEAFARVLANDSKKMIRAVNALESAIVIEAKKGEAGGRELALLLHHAGVDTISFNRDQSDLALSARRKYGKGNHPAGLNIGDCCAYALAKYSGEPLLFKGEDFSRTDIPPAIDMTKEKGSRL